MTAEDVERELNKLADPESAIHTAQSFKTNDGYTPPEMFLGLRVPVVRAVCKRFRLLPLSQIDKLLMSPIHEHRLAALIIMTEQAKRPGSGSLERLFNLYLRRIGQVNNWELVDVSCRWVVGEYLMDKPRDILYELAKSDNVWGRRVAIVSTWQFIRARQLDDTFAIAKILLNDAHAPIHRAVGWMLREAGKRDERALADFLEQHCKRMPRTALRYAVERLNLSQKAHFMAK